MDTLLQMMQRAGRHFSGLGRRQKRRMAECCDRIPGQPLVVTYSNGIKIEYTPVGVEGQFLVCKAIEKSPLHPNSVTHGGVAISMWEFPDAASRSLFREYHEALTAKCALMWDDGTPVSSRDLLGEQLGNQSLTETLEDPVEERQKHKPNRT